MCRPMKKVWARKARTQIVWMRILATFRQLSFELSQQTIVCRSAGGLLAKLRSNQFHLILCWMATKTSHRTKKFWTCKF